MKRLISCTITVGIGSERHNHNLEFRKHLKHTQNTKHKECIIELIPYIPYNTQINEMMRPYIQHYNAKQEEHYNDAWRRYEEGLIKTKPRKRDYPMMSYDYYSDHLHDKHWNPHTMRNEETPMWREIIFGLGDQNDRCTGLVSEKEAIAVMRGLVTRWPSLFPAFKLLGATIHLDEQGFYHCHIDYKPLYKKDNPKRCLEVGIGQEAALEQMGFKPEQSIINARDKAPILFNSFRNRLYLEAENELNKYGLRLWYGITKVKEPQKDSSTNQQLENWQATQDGVLHLQKLKNNMLDIIESDRVSPEGFKQALSTASELNDVLYEIEKTPRKRIKNVVEIPFKLFDQIKSLVNNLVKTVQHLLHQIDVLSYNLKLSKTELEELRQRKDSLDNQISKANTEPTPLKDLSKNERDLEL